jgi:hypothetical protein
MLAILNFFRNFFQETLTLSIVEPMEHVTWREILLSALLKGLNSVV